MHGEDPTFEFLLAEHLKKFVVEIQAMESCEYEGWRQFLKVKTVLGKLMADSETHRVKAP